MQKRERISHVIHFTSAFLLLVLGILNIIGWKVRSDSMIALYKVGNIMQINTSILFCLLALCLLMFLKCKIPSRVLAVLIIIFALLSLSQDIFGINMGIDKMIIRDYLTPINNHPGRMAPNTALCFLFSAIGILLLSIKTLKNNANGIGLLFILLTFVITLISLVGYITDISTGYTWGTSKSMSILTAISFILFIVSAFCLLINENIIASYRTSKFLPVFVFIASTSFFILFWYALYEKENQNILQEINRKSRDISEKIQSTIDERIVDLSRLFLRISSGSYISDNAIKIDEKIFRTTIPALEYLSVTNLNTHEVLILPKNNLNAITQDNISAICNGYDNYTRYNLHLNGYRGYLCIRDREDNSIAILNLKELIQGVLEKKGFSDFNIVITQGNQIIYPYPLINNVRANDSYVVNTYITINNLKWFITIWFPQNYIAKLSSKIIWMILVFGMILTVILSIMVRMWQRSHINNQLLHTKVIEQEESKVLFKTVVESSPEGILLVNHQGRVIFANEKAEKLFEYPTTELKGKCVEELMPKKFTNKQVQLRSTYMENPVSRQMAKCKDLCILTKSKKEVPVQIALSPINYQGESCIVCTILDLSERTYFENRITKQAKNIKLIYDLSAIIYEVNENQKSFQICLDLICETLEWSVGHVYLFNSKNQLLEPSTIWFDKNPKRIEHFKKITEKTSFPKGKGLPGTAWSTRMPVWIEDVSTDQAFIRGKACGQLNLHSACALPIFIKHDIIAVFELFSYMIKNRDEEIIQTLTVLSEQIGRVFERLKVLDNLSVAESRNRLLLQAAGEGIYGVNAEGNIVFFNQAAEKMLGFEADEVLGKSPHELIHHHRSNGEIYPIESCPMYLSLKDGTQHRVDDEMLWKKDGTSLWVEYLSSPLIEKGKIVGAVVLFSDISERKHARESLIKYADDLKASNQALDDFAYIASHDLKEPLRGMNNFSSFVLEDYGDKIDEEGKKQLQTICSLAKRMESLINGLLTYSRVGRLDLALKPCDVNEIVKEKIEFLDTFLKEHHAMVTIENPLPIIICDKVRIGEVFQNLITNGIKYNTSQVKEIKISEHEDDAFYIFKIADNGIGIAQENFEKIFKIFKRLHARNEYGGGTGAGMTIAQKIVEKHRGKIWLVSSLGRGTTFYFSISKTLQACQENEVRESHNDNKR